MVRRSRNIPLPEPASLKNLSAFLSDAGHCSKAQCRISGGRGLSGARTSREPTEVAQALHR
jgi:hypothetical protein